MFVELASIFNLFPTLFWRLARAGSQGRVSLEMGILWLGIWIGSLDLGNINFHYKSRRKKFDDNEIWNIICSSYKNAIPAIRESLHHPLSSQGSC
jgi:hypothetical protein